MRLRFLPVALCCASFAAASLAPMQFGFGQGTKSSAAETKIDDSEDTSVVTVALAPLDTLLPNIQHMLRTAGAGAMGGVVSTTINQYAKGLDRTRPIGVFVDLDEANQPSVVGCLPIANLEEFIEGVSIFGEPNDLGDGLYEFSLGSPIYAQKSGDWLYIAQSEDALEAIDEDMGASLQKMLQKYDIRVKLNPANIPQDMVDMFVGQMEAGVEQSMAAQRESMSEEEAATAKATSEQMIAQMEDGIKSTESVVMGLMINKAEKKTVLDFGTKFVADSKYAKQMEKAKAAKTPFAGVTQDSSMMNLQVMQLIEPEDLAQLEKVVEASLKQAMKEIDDKNKDPAVAAKAKEYIDRFVDIAMEGAKQGKADAAVDVSTDGPLSIVFSSSVADGAKVEALASDIAKDTANSKMPFKLQIGTGKHAGVNLHKLTVNLPPEADDSVRKMFGDSINVAIGTAPKAVHVAIGKSAETSLKAAIDRVAAKPSEPAQMIKMRLTLSQLLNYIQSIESTPASEAMLNAATAGNDKITIDSQTVDRGAVMRIVLEDGVVKAIAAGVKAGQASGGGF
jgi:hypothetical protein